MNAVVDLLQLLLDFSAFVWVVLCSQKLRLLLSRLGELIDLCSDGLLGVLAAVIVLLVVPLGPLFGVAVLECGLIHLARLRIGELLDRTGWGFGGCWGFRLLLALGHSRISDVVEALHHILGEILLVPLLVSDIDTDESVVLVIDGLAEVEGDSFRRLVAHIEDNCHRSARLDLVVLLLPLYGLVHLGCRFLRELLLGLRDDRYAKVIANIFPRQRLGVLLLFLLPGDDQSIRADALGHDGCRHRGLECAYVHLHLLHHAGLHLLQPLLLLGEHPLGLRVAPLRFYLLLQIIIQHHLPIGKDLAGVEHRLDLLLGERTLLAVLGDQPVEAVRSALYESLGAVLELKDAHLLDLYGIAVGILRLGRFVLLPKLPCSGTHRLQQLIPPPFVFKLLHGFVERLGASFPGEIGDELQIAGRCLAARGCDLLGIRRKTTGDVLARRPLLVEQLVELGLAVVIAEQHLPRFFGQRIVVLAVTVCAGRLTAETDEGHWREGCGHLQLRLKRGEVLELPRGHKAGDRADTVTCPLFHHFTEEAVEPSLLESLREGRVDGPASPIAECRLPDGLAADLGDAAANKIKALVYVVAERFRPILDE